MSVTVSELVVAVRIGLGALPSERCPAADRDRGGTVTAAELIAAVNSLLNSCQVSVDQCVPCDSPQDCAPNQICQTYKSIERGRFLGFCLPTDLPRENWPTCTDCQPTAAPTFIGDSCAFGPCIRGGDSELCEERCELRLTECRNVAVEPNCNCLITFWAEPLDVSECPCDVDHCFDQCVMSVCSPPPQPLPLRACLDECRLMCSCEDIYLSCSLPGGTR